jgi:hypothetical protein
MALPAKLTGRSNRAKSQDIASKFTFIQKTAWNLKRPLKLLQYLVYLGAKEEKMFLKILAVSAMSIGLATSAMAQTAGSAGQGSGTNSGAGSNGADSISGGANGSMGAGDGNSGTKGTLDVNPTNSTNMNGQNSGASGGDPNDCQRQQTGATGNPSPTSRNQSTRPDTANACK